MYNDSAEDKVRPLDALNSGIASLGFVGEAEPDEDEFYDEE